MLVYKSQNHQRRIMASENSRIISDDWGLITGYGDDADMIASALMGVQSRRPAIIEPDYHNDHYRDWGL